MKKKYGFFPGKEAEEFRKQGIERKQGIPTLALISPNGDLISAEENIRWTKEHVDAGKTVETLSCWLAAPSGTSSNWVLPVILAGLTVLSGAFLSRRLGVAAA